MDSVRQRLISPSNDKVLQKLKSYNPQRKYRKNTAKTPIKQPLNHNEMRNKIIQLYYRAKDLRVGRFWENIGRWLSYFNISRRIYDFDYSSIIAVERHQISRVRNSIAHYHNHLYAERDIERLNLALRLLDIIEEDGCCERIGKPINFVKSKNKPDLYELEDDPESYYTIPVYVNHKNAMRFCKIEFSRYTDSTDGALWQSHLRVEKAWHIYHTLRLYFMRSWWD